ncbi:MAG: C10 family peptidase [Bacteroidota bacterium]|nr:C10 family peptidase [Bacteroidota bacterium]
MKKNLFILSLALLLAITNSAFAKKITEKQARTVAKNYFFEATNNYNNAVDINSIVLSNAFVKSSKGEEVYYIYNIQPEGFIIVSAEDVMNPILGYSYEGSFDKEVENTVFDSWMNTYVEKINFFRNGKIDATDIMAERWNHYLTNEADELLATKADRDVAPLLTCTWNQDSPYNLLCPEDEDGPGGHVYAGCVATAMSMIMHHYNYPEHGTGSKSYYAYPYGTLTADFENTYYNWDAMKDNIGNSSAEHSILAIAELQYHCGVSVNMNYSPEGSGSSSSYVPDAIQDYFGYSSNSEHVQKAYYSNTQWQSMVKEQLDADHPLYYSGTEPDSPYGHAFTCDGYQGTDMFHFNFGWSGSGNGFYYLEGAGAVGGFSEGQAMVRNFYPPADSYPYNCGNKTINSWEGTLSDGGYPNQNYQTGADCSWLLTPAEGDSVINYELEFISFDTESGADIVRVYDGATTDATLLGEFSGNTIPEDLESTGNVMLITFESDDNETDNTGWRIEYEANLPTYCTGLTQYTATSGTIVDGSGEYMYNNGSICQHYILPPNANEITIMFDEFNLAEGDILKVLSTNPNEILAELTGTEIPEAITSTTGTMLLQFITNNLYREQGFSATYQIDNSGAVDVDVYSEFTAYPNPATSVLNIRFRADDINNASIKLMSIDGKLVSKRAVSNIGGYFNTEINVSDFPKGVYILNVQSNSGVATQRVIIK